VIVVISKHFLCLHLRIIGRAQVFSRPVATLQLDMADMQRMYPTMNRIKIMMILPLVKSFQRKERHVEQLLTSV
jgi:hypothetical protein